MKPNHNIVVVTGASDQKTNDASNDPSSPGSPMPVKPSLRFTSINSVNRLYGQDEDVLKYALDSITLISNQTSLFTKAFSFEFDIFKFIKYTNRPLLVLGVYLLKNSKSIRDLFNNDNKVSLATCAKFLDLCEKLYRKNPYHNNIHATDVMQFNMILLQSTFIRKYFLNYECLTAFMSAVAHDVGHIGKNNDFLVKSKHKLAIKYNNVSCLENYHIEQFHQTLNDNIGGNWMKNFDINTQHYIIDIIEYAILGTDMGMYHNKIKAELDKNYNKLFVKTHLNKGLNEKQKQFIIRAMLHLSDISNPTRTFNVARGWANRVNKEFFNQGDVMKDLGLEVSMGCDRNKTDTIKNQNGFVQFCIKPLVTKMGIMIKELDWCLNSIDINTQKWNQLKDNTTTQVVNGNINANININANNNINGNINKKVNNYKKKLINKNLSPISDTSPISNGSLTGAAVNGSSSASNLSNDFE